MSHHIWQSRKSNQQSFVSNKFYAAFDLQYFDYFIINFATLTYVGLAMAQYPLGAAGSHKTSAHSSPPKL